MNPVPLFLIIVTLPLLLGGCGEKSSVNFDQLEERREIAYIKGSYSPYTGKAYKFYENGQKEVETNFRDGKREGLETQWHENGQKGIEKNYKDGKLVEGSAKYWNSKGEPVDSEEEAYKINP